MAGQSPARHTDRDLSSIAEARTLTRAAAQARGPLAELSQARIDAIVTAMADAVTPHAEALARLAVEETGYGVVADKVQKNLFASRRVYEFIRPMQTVGIVRRDEAKKIVEIAEPFGVVAGIVPSTNPTSTAIYKVLIALKARCPIVLSPHPSAARCITRTAEILADAAREAGAPASAIGWMTTVTLEGTQELMRSRDVAVILATGGLGLVRAAYSAGKPAYGVGPGNAPCYVESSADLVKAARDIVAGKTFDNGLLCSSPNSVVADAAIAEALRRHLQAEGAVFLNDEQAGRLAAALVTPQRLPNPAFVGRSATDIARAVGIEVPEATRVLIATLAGVGRDHPLSIEKLCPVLSFYTVADWREGCQRCMQILRYGGMGHTMSIHSRHEPVILEFGLKKPAFRIVVNTPTTHGSIGLTTGLDPAMTLGCGGWGGNITSDNISPKHLLNIKRLAWELHPLPAAARTGVAAEATGRGTVPADPDRSGSSRLPEGPRRPAPEPGIAAATLAEHVGRFLASRGLMAPAPGSAPVKPSSPGSAGQLAGRVPPGPALPVSAQPAPVLPRREPAGSPSTATPPVALEFVCEDDVRTALREGRTLRIGERTIVTPAARDLGEAHRVFVEEGWPSDRR